MMVTASAVANAQATAESLGDAEALTESMNSNESVLAVDFLGI